MVDHKLPFFSTISPIPISSTQRALDISLLQLKRMQHKSAVFLNWSDKRFARVQGTLPELMLRRRRLADAIRKERVSMVLFVFIVILCSPCSSTCHYSSNKLGGARERWGGRHRALTEANSPSFGRRTAPTRREWRRWGDGTRRMRVASDRGRRRRCRLESRFRAAARGRDWVRSREIK